jgi:hypothetical protein
MTNLVEKSLITGFGIFILILFISLVFPFLKVLSEYKNDKEHTLNDYIIIIDTFDLNINELEKNPQEKRNFCVYVPENLNISTSQEIIIFEFYYNNKKYSKVLNYELSFIANFFNNMEARVYDVKISLIDNMINIEMI